MALPYAAEHAAARILIIDDEASSVQAITRVLAHAGITEVHGISDPLRAEAEFLEFQPDMVLLDLRMPGRDGLQVLQHLAATIPRSSYLPIVILTGDSRTEPRQQALAMGAKDFLTKPFDMVEVILRIKNLLETRALHKELAGQNKKLEERVVHRTRELEETQREVLQRLARAAEFRDDDTGQHTQRVAHTASALARVVGLLDEEVQLIFRAAPLHDVGKIAIPDAILLKPGKLTTEEFEVMKGHTVVGATMLGGGKTPLTRIAETIARSHHERWDGNGYPDGLEGEAIPLPARVVALADVFDALTHARPYRPAWTIDATLAEIARLNGIQFDPHMADAFLRLNDHKALV